MITRNHNATSKSHACKLLISPLHPKSTFRAIRSAEQSSYRVPEQLELDFGPTDDSLSHGHARLPW